MVKIKSNDLRHCPPRKKFERFFSNFQHQFSPRLAFFCIAFLRFKKYDLINQCFHSKKQTKKSRQVVKSNLFVRFLEETLV